MNNEEYQAEKLIFERLDNVIKERMLFKEPNLGRNKLCRLVGLNKNRFGYIIHKCSGYPNCTAYINSLRMKYASELIAKHPEYKINAIAAECGIPCISTFNRVFKEYYRVPPHTFRESVLEKDGQSENTDGQFG